MLFFCNKGVIPEEAYSLMGVNAKDSEEPFGRFGTGLKYAIATILRNGGRIWIKRWGGKGFQLLHFSSKEINVREQIFHRVTVNDEPLAYTTELGKDWSVEQAYRELVCNCRDENGKVHSAIDDEELSGKGWDTIIGVDYPEMSEVHIKSTMFLESPEITSVTLGSKHVSFHEGKSKNIYYRGVKVFSIEYSLPFTINIHHEIALTEDRTAKSEYEIRNAVNIFPYITHEEILRKILSSEHKFLTSVAYTIPARNSKLWLETCLALYRKNKLRNEKARVWLRKYLRDEKLENGGIIATVLPDGIVNALRKLRVAGFDISSRMFIIDPDSATEEMELRELGDGKLVFVNNSLFEEERILRTLIEIAVLYHTESEPVGADVDFLIKSLVTIISGMKI